MTFNTRLKLYGNVIIWMKLLNTYSQNNTSYLYSLVLHPNNTFEAIQTYNSIVKKPSIWQGFVKMPLTANNLSFQ